MTASLTFRFPARWFAVLGLCTSLIGCGNFSGNFSRDSFKPYVPEVVQGNFVSREQVDALQPGMSRQQVRDSTAQFSTSLSSRTNAWLMCS